ncbi:DUF1206 domain-containing protein [Kribbella sandramycini]|uniref:DUF1206 domain-containing protein n=1 Tax=Kribbella sandramycini TaxID=60450 RepID=A0A7Y4P223_9ACTN|nr:DUF1206 domain-containing protein [Kribbella sandramycini]MBB6567165.1 hypothetical protein [Kribbella sandramycini]NOL44882.1 DUF1206 domain-containing protein [Kribbella sandramycini]
MKSAQQVRHTQWYGVTVSVGLIAYGVVHLLIAWIALQLAWGNSSQEASQQGALEEIASKPLGGVLLWVVAVGLFALVLWRVLDLLYGDLDLEKRASSTGRAVVYLVLGISAVKVAIGSGGSSSNQQQTFTAKLMENGAGRVLVVIVGLVIIGIGVRQLHKAYTKKFTEDLVGGVSHATVQLGRVGYAAKGVAFVVVGVLFGWAAIGYDPDKAGGLDTALRTIKEQPFGSVLLTVLALGIAAFGVYCFAWSRNAKL